MAGLATVAGACCAPVIAPAVVAVLGAGGAAWAAGLGPWARWILSASAVLVAAAHWQLRSVASTTPDCSPPASGRVLVAVWGATVVWLLALAIQLWAAVAGSTG